MARHYPTLTRSGFLLPSNIKASYEGAGEGRRSASWDAPDVGINSLNTPALRNLRARSRAAVRNDPYAFNVIDKRVSNLIGTGISPRPKTEDDALRKREQELWDDWVEESDADGLTDFYGQQALIARTVEIAGECFVRLRPRSPDDNLAVPLQLQVLAPEFVPHDKFEPAKNGNSIRAGIEFNPAHQRVAYHMYRVHPRDAASLNSGYNQLVRIPAEQVLHIFEPVEPGQLRGVPRLAPVLKRLRSLDNYDDAVLFRQEVANLFAGFISRPPPEGRQVALDPVTGQPFTEDRDGFTPMVALEPGTMQELGPGEEVEFSKPPDAGNNYPDFMRQQLMAAAAGTGTPYEILSGDMREVNDRALRVVLSYQNLDGTNRAGLGTQTAASAAAAGGYAYQYRGDSPEENIQGVLSFQNKLSSDVTVYGNLLASHRKDVTYGFYRVAGESRNIAAIYPNGYLPEQVPTSLDV